MVQQINGKEVKDKIKKYLEEKGPSLPIPIAKHIGMNTIFASAFLSEMSSEGTIKISYLKVGGSPLYYTPDKVALLENSTKFLGEKEQEAQSMLKESKVLQDESLHPAIRVALRGLKDFAIPFKKDEKVFWRYFLTTEEEIKEILEPKAPEKIEEKPAIKEEEPKKEDKLEEKKEEKTLEKIDKKENITNKELENINKQIEEKRKELEKINKELSEIVKEKRKPKLHPIKKVTKKKPKVVDEKFLNEVKANLKKKGIILIKIEQFDKKQVIARVQTAEYEKEKLLFAFDKKKIDESDVLKIYKKAKSMNADSYIIFCAGEPSKKAQEAFDAFKSLSSVEKLEEAEDKEQKTLNEEAQNNEQ